MITKTRIRILTKAYEKTLATQKIINEKAFSEICKELEKLLYEDSIAYEKMLPYVSALIK